MFGFFKYKSPVSAFDEKQISSIVKDVQTSGVVHGSAKILEEAGEFAPVEHPIEPPEHDQPVRCPPPEPCIIHDGRLWKERLQLSIKRRKELPYMREAGLESAHARRHTSEHSILPSMSAPANTILKLLESS